MYIGIVAGTGCILLFIILWISTVLLRKRIAGGLTALQEKCPVPAELLEHPPAEKLAEAIRLRTVSTTDYSAIDIAEYRKVSGYFFKQFPKLTAETEFTVLNDFSYIFHWKGTDPGLRPALLLAHFDVVPAVAEAWSIPPFEGRVQDGYVWGRGALDTKCTLVGMLEAAERLLQKGFQPKRSWYFVSSGDEETFGIEGARTIAEYFRKHNIYFDFVLDEGTIVSLEMLPDIRKPLALLGISEKGYADFVLEACGKGGHASMPPKENPAKRIAEAVRKLENSRKKQRIPATVRQFLHTVIPYVPFWKRLIYANLWLFRPLCKRMLSANLQTRSLIETTAALTMLSAGESENVIPSRARAVYNVRILPGDTVAAACRRFQKMIKSFGVSVSVLDEREINDPVTGTLFHDAAAKRLATVIGQVFPDALIAPFLSTVTTDSKYYRHVSDKIFRFVPIVLSREEVERIHGIDERISLENLGNILHFYLGLILSFS